MDLSPDQKLAFDRCLDFATAGGKPQPGEPDRVEVFKMSGLAGTGKTTVLGHIAKALQDQKKLVAYATFTGRASGRLKQSLARAGVQTTSNQLTKSLDADTSLSREELTMPFCGTLHKMAYQAIIDQTTEECLGYRKRFAADREYACIVVDEASMVGDEMLRDIKMLGVRILAVGDHGQLPPVGDRGSLMENPDIKLEKIHRQAEGNPIIRFAHTMRETGRIDRTLACDEIRFGRRADIGKVFLDAAVDCIRAEQDRLDTAAVPHAILDVGALCYRNKTRIDLNREIRRALQYEGPPRDGEVVMCVKNTNFGPMNGMRGIVVGDSKPLDYRIAASLKFPQEEVDCPMALMCGYQFHREKTIGSVEEMQKQLPGLKSMAQLGNMLCDFGYSGTVHKFQGSSLKHAIWVVDRNYNTDDLDWRRFAYTAVTRASERLTVLF